MRKRNKGRTLSLKKGPRTALLRTLVNSFFMHGKIKTTEAKAKEIKPMIEKMITRAKTGSVANRRVLAQKLTIANVKKVVGEIAPKYSERPGGYTRIIRTGRRPSDGASTVIIELV